MSDASTEFGRANVDLPSIARIYDYHLGGSANFAVDREAGDELERIYPDALMAGSSTPMLHWRSREQVAELLPGYQVLEPGVVPTAAWRPEQTVSEQEAARSNAYAAVGMLR